MKSEGILPQLFRFLIGISVLLGLSAADVLRAADRKVVLYLRKPETAQMGVAFVEAKNLKINGQKKLAIGSSMTHSRRQYRSLPRAEFGNLQSIEWAEGDTQLILVTSSGQRQTCYCYPDKAPPPNDAIPIHAVAMGNATVTAEFLVGRSKVKRQLQMNAIQKIFFVPEHLDVDEVIFAWSREEDTIESWKRFLTAFPQSQRVPAAKDGLIHVLLMAGRTALQKFESGGMLADAWGAQQYAEQALEIRDDAPARQLRESAIRQEREVRDQVKQVQSLLDQQLWDAALEAYTPIQRFAPEITEMAGLEHRARQGGHDAYRQQGQAAMEAQNWEQAVSAFAAALKMIASDEAGREFREARIRLALRDAAQLQAQQQFPQATELLETVGKELGSDSRMLELLGRVKTQWAQFLIREAGPVSRTALRIDNAAAEEKARHLLGNYETANRLSPQAETESTVAQLRRSLATYYFQLGQRKLTLPRGVAIGQAYLYFQQAESYDNEIAGLLEATELARTAFRNKSSIGVRITFTDKSPRKACEYVVAELEGRAGEAVVNARLPNVNLVEREEFQRLKEEQALTQAHSENGLNLNIQGAGVQVLGDIFLCEAKRQERNQQIPSQHISGYRENPQYLQLSQQVGQLQGQYDYLLQQVRSLERCADQEKRQNYMGPCRTNRNNYENQLGTVQNQLYNARSALQNTPAQFPIYAQYAYLRQDISVSAAIKGGFRIVDSLSSVRREQQQISEETSRSDFQITGTRAQDTRGVQDRLVNMPSEDELLQELIDRTQGKVGEDTVSFLRQFSAKYLERARRAIERRVEDEAVENYILFMATSPAKGGPEYEEATNFVRDKRNLVFRPDVI